MKFERLNNILDQIANIDNPILWTVIGFALLVVIVKIIGRIRDRRLIKSVTSLNRGTKSEREFILSLLKHDIPSQTIFHDLCVRKNNGKFSQIDVVVVTTQGILVFEVKDFSGWIFGSGNNSQLDKSSCLWKKEIQVL